MPVRAEGPGSTKVKLSEVIPALEFRFNFVGAELFA
jgi:hypothetical protein